MRDKNKFYKLKSSVPYQYYCVRCKRAYGTIYLHDKESVCYNCLKEEEKKNIVEYERK